MIAATLSRDDGKTNAGRRHHAQSLGGERSMRRRRTGALRVEQAMPAWPNAPLAMHRERAHRSSIFSAPSTDAVVGQPARDHAINREAVGVTKAHGRWNRQPGPPSAR